MDTTYEFKVGDTGYTSGPVPVSYKIMGTLSDGTLAVKLAPLHGIYRYYPTGERAEEDIHSYGHLLPPKKTRTVTYPDLWVVRHPDGCYQVKLSKEGAERVSRQYPDTIVTHIPAETREVEE